MGQPAKPGMSPGVMLMVIPRERDQDVDIQQIHASFLGQGVRDIFGRNFFARVMHQNAVLAVSLGCHRGKLRLWLTVLRDGELLAARDLPEQIRERGLGFFQCDCLHNGETLTRLPAQGQYFCEPHARGRDAPRQGKRRAGDGSKALNAAGIFRPKEPRFQNLICDDIREIISF